MSWIRVIGSVAAVICRALAGVPMFGCIKLQRMHFPTSSQVWNNLLWLNVPVGLMAVFPFGGKTVNRMDVPLQRHLLLRCLE